MKIKSALLFMLLGLTQVTKPAISLKDAVLLSGALGGFLCHHVYSEEAAVLEKQGLSTDSKTYKRTAHHCAIMGALCTVALTPTILGVLKAAFVKLLIKI